MDPNANLAEQLRLTAEIEDLLDPASETYGDTPTLEATAARLVELVEALNGWIVGGGFLPKAWGRGRS